MLGRYLVKYITKSYLSNTDGWRTRMSQGYGTRYLRSIIETFPINQTRDILCLKAPTLLLRNGLKVPARIIRTEATKHLGKSLKNSQVLTRNSQPGLRTLVEDLKGVGKYHTLMNTGRELTLQEIEASDERAVLSTLVVSLNKYLVTNTEAIRYGQN